MDIVNEQTTYRIVAQFSGEDGAPVTPTSAQYRIDDLVSGAAVKDWTSLTVDGATTVLVVAYVENSILDDTNDYEERIVTVTAEYGVGKKCAGEYRYKVRNLSKLGAGTISPIAAVWPVPVVFLTEDPTPQAGKVLFYALTDGNASPNNTITLKYMLPDGTQIVVQEMTI